LATADVETLNYPAHAEGANPVPWADRITFSTLVAKLEDFSAGLPYLIDNLYEGGDYSHCFY
jgi:hypothetical protein